MVNVKERWNNMIILVNDTKWNGRWRTSTFLKGTRLLNEFVTKNSERVEKQAFT